MSPWPGRSGGCCGWQGPCWCWGPPQPAGREGERAPSRAGDIAAVLSRAKKTPRLGGRLTHGCLQHVQPLDVLLPPSGPREPAHPGSPHAGGAAVRAAGHHPVHGLVGVGELRCGRAGQHLLSLDSCATRRAGTGGEGLLNLVYLTVLFLFFFVFGFFFPPCGARRVALLRAITKL